MGTHHTTYWSLQNYASCSSIDFELQQFIWAFGPVGRNIHCDHESGCKGGGRTPKVCCELANVLLCTVSSCL